VKGVPLIRVSAAAPFVRFLREMGAPIDRLLDNVGLAAATLSRPEVLLPAHQVLAFIDAAARAQGLEHLGLIVGQRTSIEDALGSFGSLLAAASSLHEALHTAVRLCSAFASDGRLRLDLKDGQVWLRHTYDRRLERGWREAEQFTLMMMVQLVRLASARPWRPREVQLRAERGVGLEGIEPLADARITFGHASTGIEIPRALLREPFVGVRPAPFVRGKLEHDLLATAPAVGFAASIRQTVRTHLTHCYPSVRFTAGAIGMSVRTVQRRLFESGVSFSRLVQQERVRLAAALLTEPRVTITDVAAELGYKDLANFTHAFHRWTGFSPSEYRRNEVWATSIAPYESTAVCHSTAAAMSSLARTRRLPSIGLTKRAMWALPERA